MEIRRVDTHEEEHAGESYAANADFGMPAAVGMFYRRREALSVVLANICRVSFSPPPTATSSAGKVGGQILPDKHSGTDTSEPDRVGAQEPAHNRHQVGRR